MNETVRKPPRAFLTLTLITVLTVAMVFIVYAALLATYMGQNVTVNTLGGEVQYSSSLTGDITGPYSAGTLSMNNGTEWWARLVITNPATQTVSVTWTLQFSNGTAWKQITTSDFPLSSSNNIIYATSDGSGPTGNYNWGQDTDVQTEPTLTYQVKAVVNTP